MPATATPAPGSDRRRWQVLRIDVGPHRVSIHLSNTRPRQVLKAKLIAHRIRRCEPGLRGCAPCRRDELTGCRIGIRLPKNQFKSPCWRRTVVRERHNYAAGNTARLRLFEQGSHGTCAGTCICTRGRGAAAPATACHERRERRYNACVRDSKISLRRHFRCVSHCFRWQISSFTHDDQLSLAVDAWSLPRPKH